jgi:hypothetical protein
MKRASIGLALIFAVVSVLLVTSLNAKTDSRLAITKLAPQKATLEITVPMSVDVDGAPKSYGPNDKEALDFELNAHVGAKKSGRIVGYLLDGHGKPVIQGPNDPAPGFFVSTTRFVDKNNNRETDPRRYLDATEINYTVLASRAAALKVKRGDFCVVHAITKNKTVFAIVGDTGHSNGAEGSLALLQRLGFKVKNGKSVQEKIDKIVVRYFKNTNPTDQFFFKQSDLDAVAEQLGLDTDFSQFHRP